MIADGIPELFASLDGYTRYEQAIEQWAFYTANARAEYLAEYRRTHRRQAVETTREWRKKNPERTRVLAREATERWRKKNPDKRKRAKDRYRAKYPEKVRAWNRKNQAARRARLKAQGK